MTADDLTGDERSFVQAAEAAFPDYAQGGRRLLGILSGARQWGASPACLSRLQEIAEQAALVRMTPEQP